MHRFKRLLRLCGVALLQVMPLAAAQPEIAQLCQATLPVDGQERWQRFSDGLDQPELINSQLRQLVQAGYGADTVSSEGFESLGAIVSAAKQGVMQVGGVRTKVLVFGGGYPSAGYTVDEQWQQSGQGNAVFVVSAASGELIWRATSANAAGTPAQVVDKTWLMADMIHSVPASPALLDLDGDGLTDRIYLSDLAGQLFRFDIQQGQSGARLLTGQLLARLGDGKQQFFTTPDVALVSDRGRTAYLSLALGSGSVAALASQTGHNRFYVLRDFYVKSLLPADFRPLTDADLRDASELESAERRTAEGQADMAWLAQERQAVQNGPGYFIRLQAGEAVLSNSISYRGNVLFSTVSLNAGAQAACPDALQAGRTLALSLRSSAGVLLGQQEGQPGLVRSQPRLQPGIPPTPVILVGEFEPGRLPGLECAEDLCLVPVRAVTPRYWREELPSP